MSPCNNNRNIFPNECEKSKQVLYIIYKMYFKIMERQVPGQLRIALVAVINSLGTPFLLLFLSDRY